MRIGEFSDAFQNSRKPIVWLINQNGKQIFVLGLHLPSKGTNTPDWGNRQPPQHSSDPIRERQAEEIQAFINNLISLNVKVPIIVAGDLNDYPWSNTLRILLGDDLINAASTETLGEQYSYIFEGNASQFDYLLINKNMKTTLIQTKFVHINTTLDQSLSISDHDPVIIEISME